jgi:hypothetical protein
VSVKVNVNLHVIQADTLICYMYSILCYVLLSRVYGYVTNKNGFWAISLVHNKSSAEHFFWDFQGFAPFSFSLSVLILFSTTYIVSWLTHRKHRFLYCCEGMFTAPSHSNRHGANHIENISCNICLYCIRVFRRLLEICPHYDRQVHMLLLVNICNLR